MADGQIHGHEIIDIVRRHPAGIGLADLAATAEREFGSGARFFTCSAEEMDLAGLLDFLVAREKVRVEAGVVFPGGSPPCDHG
jgi:probable metal-binding protein